MTDYLEELLDQLEEEEAETAAHWMDALRPALFDPLSESSGSAEPEAVGRQARSPAAQRAENGLEGPPPVQAEAQGSLEAQEDVGASPASAPQEAWAATWSPAPPEEKRSEARILGRLWAPDWSVSQPDVLAEAAVEGGERPAALPGRRRAAQPCRAGQGSGPEDGWNAGRTPPRQWTGPFSGTAGAMTRALPCTEEGAAVRLTPMRYKNYTWPHNPRVYSIDYERKMAVHKVPFGLYHLQDLGRTRRVMEGEGEFVGADAYSQFGQLANVFYDSGPGLLVHPLWQAASAYFVALRLEQEPRPDYVRYSFTFWEDVSYYSGEVRTFAPAQETAAGGSGVGGGYHLVRQGDTFWSIARQYGLSLEELAAKNPQIRNPNLIRVGEKVRII